MISLYAQGKTIKQSFYAGLHKPVLSENFLYTALFLGQILGEVFNLYPQIQEGCDGQEIVDILQKTFDIHGSTIKTIWTTIVTIGTVGLTYGLLKPAIMHDINRGSLVII
ncbi:MAG TPA: hypothetical protein VGW78_05830 [Candidatus Babeliales bacterium]|jgi:hypothetical protein|nr:hypothetical protein [Candidatus Babeliales bacterium]